MRFTVVVAACLFAASSWFRPDAVSAVEAELPATTATLAELFRAALESELSGPSELRKVLLDQALEVDPEFAPARWQSGFLRRDGKWLTVEQAAHAANSDESLSAYRKLRDQLANAAENQAKLATWCRKHKLRDEERIHWAKVLEFEPNNDAALDALGLQFYDGQLLTKQQIEQRKREAGERQRVMRHWQPQLLKWRAAIESGSEKQRASAIENLRALNAPETISALETVFARNAESPKSTELNLLLVDAVGHMPQQEATNVLLRRAVDSDSEKVRQAAADRLKKRSPFAYVPQLVSELMRVAPENRGRIESHCSVYVFANEAVRIHELRYFDGVNDHKITLVSTIFSRLRASELPSMIVAEVAEIDRQVKIMNEATDGFSAMRSDRIKAVLRNAADFKGVADAGAMLQQWQDYSDSYVSPSFPATMPQQAEVYVTYRQMSCFPAGTPVCTMTGPEAIESIRAGDHVLAQDPKTGELAYRTVQAVTLRPPAKMIEIGLGSETIRATRGHPFWVNGKGWLMAKQLKIGDVLHSLKGAVVVDNLQDAPAKEAYNLVVSDFNTYFVGDQQILVHDNLPLQETAGLVPGMLVDTDFQATK